MNRRQSSRKGIDPSAPLGVFDSGLGGLTVVRELRRVLPHENIVYLGDNARVPYGTKGPATIVKYALGCAHHLMDCGVKAIIVACNTVSAVALDAMRLEVDLPVLGVIEPGARAAVGASRSGKIGVLATAATISSGAYVRAVALLSAGAVTIARAAPLLVPLAEEGWLEGDVPTLAVQRYLAPLSRENVDVIVLGCTHYPLFRTLIEVEARAMLGSGVVVVDSAQATASDVRVYLEQRGMSAVGARGAGSVKVVVTDIPKAFGEVASRFLGEEIGEVQQVDL